MKKLALFAVFLAFLGVGGWGQTTYTWIGGQTPNTWTNEDNFLEGVAPGDFSWQTAGDTLIIDCLEENSPPLFTGGHIGTLIIKSGSFTLNPYGQFDKIEISGGSFIVYGGSFKVDDLTMTSGLLDVRAATNLDIDTNNFKIEGGILLYNDSTNVGSIINNEKDKGNISSDVIDINDPSILYIWHGNKNTDWTDDDNWEGNSPLTGNATYEIVINTMNNHPIIENNITCNKIANNGTLILNGGTITATQTSIGGTVEVRSTYTGGLGTITSFHNLTIDTGGSLTLNNSITVSGELKIDGNLNAGSNNITINNGVWRNNSGNFSIVSGTVTFNNASVYGDNTFTTLICEGDVYFEAGKTQVVTTLNAINADLLTSIGSSSYWNLNVPVNGLTTNSSKTPRTVIRYCYSTVPLNFTNGGEATWGAGNDTNHNVFVSSSTTYNGENLVLYRGLEFPTTTLLFAAHPDLDDPDYYLIDIDTVTLPVPPYVLDSGNNLILINVGTITQTISVTPGTDSVIEVRGNYTRNGEGWASPNYHLNDGIITYSGSIGIGSKFTLTGTNNKIIASSTYVNFNASAVIEGTGSLEIQPATTFRIYPGAKVEIDGKFTNLSTGLSTLEESISANGGIEFNGAVTIGDGFNVTLESQNNDIVFNTQLNSGNASSVLNLESNDGNITFGTITGLGSLEIDAGSGDVEFTNTIGAGTTNRPANITITDANDVTFANTVFAGRVEVTAANTNIGANITTTGTGTTGGQSYGAVTLDAATVVLTSTVTGTNITIGAITGDGTNILTIDGNASLAGGTGIDTLTIQNGTYTNSVPGTSIATNVIFDAATINGSSTYQLNNVELLNTVTFNNSINITGNLDVSNGITAGTGTIGFWTTGTVTATADTVTVNNYSGTGSPSVSQRLIALSKTVNLVTATGGASSTIYFNGDLIDSRVIRPTLKDINITVNKDCILNFNHATSSEDKRYNKLTISSGYTLTLGSSIAVASITVNGIFSAGSYDIELFTGEWVGNVTTATFTHSGELWLSGVRVYGNNTFSSSKVQLNVDELYHNYVDNVNVFDTTFFGDNTFGSLFNIARGTVIFEGDNTFEGDVTCDKTGWENLYDPPNSIDVPAAVTIKFGSGTTQTFNGKFDTTANSNINPLYTTTLMLKDGDIGRWKIEGLDDTDFTTNENTTIANCNSELFLNRVKTGSTYNRAQDGGNNQNVFAGGTFYWVGTVSNAWELADNWSSTDPDSAPTVTAYSYPSIGDTETEIIISSASALTNELILTVDTKCGTMLIRSGAEIVLSSYTLTVSSSTAITNNGIIKLHGTAGQITPAPAGTIGGTIHYYGATASWVFGNTYNNLEIYSTSGTLPSFGALQVNGTARFVSTSDITAASVNITGASTISANITTTGTQTYSQNIASGGAQISLVGDVIFNSSSTDPNAIRFNGTVVGDGGTLTIDGNGRFNYGANTLASISVSGTSWLVGTITTTGDQTYTGAVLLGSGTVTDNIILNSTGASSTITFGNTVENNNAGRTLTINSGNIIFNNHVGRTTTTISNTTRLGSLTITGSTTINGTGTTINTTGNQQYQTVNFGAATQSLTSTGGSVTITGEASGTNGLTVSALQGITIDNPDNTLSGTVTLNNTQGTTQSGNVSFSTSSDVTITGSNPAANGAFSVDTSSGNANITVGTDGINNPTVGTNTRVNLKTGNGTVNITGEVSASGNGLEGDGIAAIYINASNMTGTVPINLINGAVCANLDNYDFTGQVYGGRGIHFHARNRHIVYADTNPGITSEIGDYLWIQSYRGNIGTNPVLNVSGDYSIYAINVGTVTEIPNNRIPTFNYNTAGDGFVQIRNTYNANNVFLINGVTTGGETLQLHGANITLTNAWNAGWSLSLLNSASSIKAEQITLPVTSTIDGGFDLTLESDTNITIQGNIGATTPLGAVVITADSNINLSAKISTNNQPITFSGPVNIEGAIVISTGGTAAINVDDDITLDSGADVVLNGALNLDPATGNITIEANDGGAVSLTSVITAAGNTLTLKGGTTEANALNIRSNVTHVTNPVITNSDVIISTGTYTAVSSGFFQQPDGATLTLEAGASFDTSAGGWSIGDAGTAADTFSGIDGTINLDEESKLVTNKLNLTSGSFAVNNSATQTAYAIIEAKGNVDIQSYDPSLITNLVLYMNGGTSASIQTQTLTSTQRLGRLRVGEHSHTELVNGTGYIYEFAEVIIEAASAPAGLDAGDNDIVLYAGLTGTRNTIDNTLNGTDPVSIGRWHYTTQAGLTSLIDLSNFVFRQGIDNNVRFAGNPSDPNTAVFYEIIGNTMWQNFICEVPGAVLQFSLDPHYHMFLQSFILKGQNAGKEITLTRYTPLNDTWVYKYTGEQLGSPGIPSTPNPPPVPIDRSLFWNFGLVGDSSPPLVLEHVEVYFSYASFQRISTSPFPTLAATPYYNADTNRGHFCYEWVEVLNRIMYSFAEDWRGNGRINRIRVQVNSTPVQNSDSFSGFQIEVRNADGEIVEIDRTLHWHGFQIVQEQTSGTDDNDSFYIYLKENEGQGLYDGRPYTWRIIQNNTLYDIINGKLIGLPEDNETFTTINTIPPRISYALALPDHDEIYVEFSQPVVWYEDAWLAGISEAFVSQLSSEIGGTNPRITPVNTQNCPPYLLEYLSNTRVSTRYNLRSGYEWAPPQTGTRGFIIKLDTPPSVSELSQLRPIGDASTNSYLWFILDGFRNMAVRALDWGDPNIDPDDFSNYKPPRYPVDWNYTGYEPQYGNGHAAGLSPDTAPLNPLFLPPYRVLTPAMERELATPGGSVTPADFDSGTLSSPNRRITDVLVSIEPETMSDNAYFAWPVYAKVTDDPSLAGYPDFNDPAFDFWGQTVTDQGIIWDFDGTRMLDLRDPSGIARSVFDLQARVHGDITGTHINMYYANGLNIGTAFRNPPVAQQQSTARSGGLWLPEMPDALTNIVPRYYPHTLNTSVVSIPSSRLPMFNNVDISTMASGAVFEFFFNIPGSDMLIARLDVPKGTAVPSNWYELVRPFRFGITDLIRQSGGVTIVNNVINSDNREITYLRYRLTRPGRVTIQVYTLEGNLVYSIARNMQQEAGEHTVGWDGTNNAGRPVARGMYFIRITAPDIDEIRKVLVIR